MNDSYPVICAAQPPIPGPMKHSHRCCWDVGHTPSDRHECVCGLKWSEELEVNDGEQTIQMVRIPTDVAYGNSDRLVSPRPPSVVAAARARWALPPLPDTAYPEDAVELAPHLPDPDDPVYVDYEIMPYLKSVNGPVFVRGVDDVAMSATHFVFYCNGRVVYAHPAAAVYKMRIVGIDWPGDDDPASDPS